MTGADAHAKAWAIERGCPEWPFPAAWDDIERPGAVVRRTRAGKPYDAAAGPYRNGRMLSEGAPDLVLAFPGGDGTDGMVALARSAGVPVHEITD